MNAPDPGSEGGRRPTSDLRKALDSADLSAAASVLSAMSELHGVRTATAGSEGAPGTSGEIGALTPERAFVPFYFTDPDRARAYALEHDLVEEGAAAVFAEGPEAVVRSVLERGFPGMVIDPGSEAATVVRRPQLEVLADRLASAEGAEEAEKEPPPPAAGRAGEEGLAPPPHLLDLADRVRRSPELAAVVAPDLDSREAGDLVRELRQLLNDDRMPPWQAVEILAFRVPLHVPVSPRPLRGLRWPLVVRHPKDRRIPAVPVFVDGAEAAGAWSTGSSVETLRVSGLEAFRWILAAPPAVEEILVYPGPSEAPLRLPDRWALGALYPHAYEDVELDRVHRVAPEALGGLPGARGTKPETVRALVEGWEELLEVDGSGDGKGGPPEAVEHAGRRYLPAFSGRAALQDFQSLRPGAGTAPAVRDPEAPPFRRWLRRAADVDGVLLDPGARTPLPLDHTDLAVLALWSESGARPTGEDLVGLVSSETDALGPRARGRILADWPGYYWAVHPGREGSAPGPLTMPGRDTCPVFSNEDRIQRFLARARNRGLVDPDVEALLYLTSWAFNVFREMHARYRDGGWIDPPAGTLDDRDEVRERAAEGGGSAPDEKRNGPAAEGSSGVRVSGDTLRSALARIEWRLQPRVPGFLARE